MLLETTIYESPMGYVPHIKWNSKLINEFGGNQMKGLNDKIRNIFPDVIDKLNKAGIVSKGREMYAKGIINRTFTSLEEALVYANTHNPYEGPEIQDIVNIVEQYRTDGILSKRVKCHTTNHFRSFTHDAFIVKCDNGNSYLVLYHEGVYQELHKL